MLPTRRSRRCVSLNKSAGARIATEISQHWPAFSDYRHVGVVMIIGKGCDKAVAVRSHQQRIGVADSGA